MFFEWDKVKEQQNIAKHGVSFDKATQVFADDNRVVIEDLSHSRVEKRLVCLGKIDGRVVTVRFTYRGNKIRIFGAGYWRKGTKRYEKENQI